MRDQRRRPTPISPPPAAAVCRASALTRIRTQTAGDREAHEHQGQGQGQEGQGGVATARRALCPAIQAQCALPPTFTLPRCTVSERHCIAPQGKGKGKKGKKGKYNYYAPRHHPYY